MSVFVIMYDEENGQEDERRENPLAKRMQKHREPKSYYFFAEKYDLLYLPRLYSIHQFLVKFVLLSIPGVRRLYVVRVCLMEPG